MVTEAGFHHVDRDAGEGFGEVVHSANVVPPMHFGIPVQAGDDGPAGGFQAQFGERGGQKSGVGKDRVGLVRFDPVLDAARVGIRALQWRYAIALGVGGAACQKSISTQEVGEHRGEGRLVEADAAMPGGAETGEGEAGGLMKIGCHHRQARMQAVEGGAHTGKRIPRELGEIECGGEVVEHHAMNAAASQNFAETRGFASVLFKDKGLHRVTKTRGVRDGGGHGALEARRKAAQGGFNDPRDGAGVALGATIADVRHPCSDHGVEPITNRRRRCLHVLPRGGGDLRMTLQHAADGGGGNAAMFGDVAQGGVMVLLRWHGRILGRTPTGCNVFQQTAY